MWSWFSYVKGKASWLESEISWSEVKTIGILSLSMPMSSGCLWGFGVSQRSSCGAFRCHSYTPTLYHYFYHAFSPLDFLPRVGNGGGKRWYVTLGHLPDDRSNVVKRVLLTRKTRPGASSHVIPDPGHPTLRRWKRLRPPSSEGVGGEVGGPRNLWGWVRFALGRLEPAFGGNRHSGFPAGQCSRARLLACMDRHPRHTYCPHHHHPPPTTTHSHTHPHTTTPHPHTPTPFPSPALLPTPHTPPPPPAVILFENRPLQLGDPGVTVALAVDPWRSMTQSPPRGGGGSGGCARG